MALSETIYSFLYLSSACILSYEDSPLETVVEMIFYSEATKGDDSPLFSF